MKILLINILFLWCIICSLITNISATVRIENGVNDSSRYIRKLFKDYCLKLTPHDIRKSVLKDNDVLANELCDILGLAFDPGKKTCELFFVSKEVKLDEKQFAWIELARCKCFGNDVKTFYLREYPDAGGISVYFILDIIEKQLFKRTKDKYLGVTLVFDGAYNIAYRNFYHGKIQNSVLTPPPQNGTQNLLSKGKQEKGQSSTTKAT